MVSKKDKDAEAGLQVFWIMGIVWTIGFLYWTWGDVTIPASNNHTMMLCCNSLNVFGIVLFFYLWSYTYRENKVKKYIEEYLESSDSISVDHLEKEFNIKNKHASRALGSWASQPGTGGVLDRETGIFMKWSSDEE